MRQQSGTNIICYVVLLAAHIVLVWLLPYFPTQDGPSHLYNLVILHDLLNGGGEWGTFFASNLRPVPNLGFHIVAYPLISFFSPLIIEKLFVSLYILLLAAAVPVFLRSFDRHVFPFAFMVFPVVFNFTLLMGFYSYVLAVPLFLAAFAVAWKRRHAGPLFQFVFLNVAGIVIFYCHLIPFVFFLIALFAAATVEAAGWKGKLSALLRLIVTVSPLLALFIYYQLGGSGESHLNLSYLASFSRFVDLTEHLLFFSTITFTRSQAIVASFFLFIYLFLLAVYILDVLKAARGKEPDSACFTPSEKTLVVLATLLLMIYYAAPFRLGEGSYFNQRFPWVIFLVLLPLLRIPEIMISRRLASAIVLCAVIPVFAFNVPAMRRQSADVSEFLGGRDADLSPGVFIMAYKSRFPQWSDIDVLMHAVSYYGMYKKCVDAGNYEAALPYFPVSFKKTLPPLPSQDTIAYDPAKIKWSLYPWIRYLFAWDLSPAERETLGMEFRVIRENRRLSIWERKPPGAEAPN